MFFLASVEASRYTPPPNGLQNPYHGNTFLIVVMQSSMYPTCCNFSKFLFIKGAGLSLFLTVALLESFYLVRSNTCLCNMKTYIMFHNFSWFHIT